MNGGPAGHPRVALVHDWLTGLRGGEKVLEELIELLPAAELFTLLHIPGSVGPRIGSRPIHTSFLQQLPGAARWYRHYLPLMPAAIEDLDLTGFDVVVSSSHCVAKGVIAPPGSRHLCYCHTPMRYAWDQEHAYFPRRTGLIARVRSLLLSRLRSWDVTSSARVDRFIANSHFVAERIRRYYRRDAEVIHPPVDIAAFTPDPGCERESFVLVVQALVPYKRVDLAIAAAATAGRPLVVVGTGPELSRLEQLAEGASVQFAGAVSHAQLLSLYRRAACVLQPGSEDFGIAAVEALACGTPIVALGRGGICDIVVDETHGVLVAPLDASPAAFAAAIDKCRDLRFDYEDLRRQAEQFSATRFRAAFGALLDSELRALGGRTG